MKAICMRFFIVALFLGVFVTLSGAQDSTSQPIYLAVDYLKVSPGMGEEYLKMEKAWKKLHIAKKKAGIISDWAIYRVMYPSGTAADYDYVAVQTINGSKNLATYHESNYMPADWKSLLTTAEIALVNKTSDLRKHVKSEVWSFSDGTFADNWKSKATIQVFNYFSLPDGMWVQEHGEMEREVWKPIHAARIADGNMIGWALINLQMPYGFHQPYRVATADFYENMEQFVTDSDMEEYFKKAHPDKSTEEIEKLTNSGGTLGIGEIRRLVDRLD